MLPINKISGIYPLKSNQRILAHENNESKPREENPTIVPQANNVINIQHLITKQENNDLINGWKNLSPFINGLVKVIKDSKSADPVWMLVWIKNEAALFYNYSYKPIPNESKLFSYLTSTNSEKQKIVLDCEKLLLNAYLDAKNFVNGGQEVQSGFEITGQDDCMMRVRGYFGIEVSYTYVDCLLEVLENNVKGEIDSWQQFFKGVFAHEMTHCLRNEILNEGDNGQEIASHAIEMLSTSGNNLIADLSFSKKIADPSTSYNKDLITGLKVLQQKLSSHVLSTYKPKTHEPNELNKSIKSIQEDKREEVLKEIAQEIIKTSAIDLLRIAAQANVIPLVKADVVSLLKEWEKAG